MKPVHIHKEKSHTNFNVFLLLIPSLVFFLVLFLYITLEERKPTVATTEIKPSQISQEKNLEPKVLGEDDETFDKK